MVHCCGSIHCHLHSSSVLNHSLHAEGSFKFFNAASAAEVINVKWEDNHELVCTSGPGSIVSIATGYGLDGPGIKSRRG